MKDYSYSMPSPPMPRDATLPLAIALGDKFTQEGCRHLFYDGDWIEGADVKSFRHITAMVGRDSHHVYFCDSVLTDADPATFEVIDSFVVNPQPHKSVSWYVARDIKTAFLFNESWRSAVVGAEALSFRRLSFGYFRDQTQVFYYSSLISGADPNTFEVLSELYARDAHNAYYKNSILGDVAISTDFKLIGDEDRGYAGDGCKVFLNGRAVPNADAPTFRCVGGDYAVDHKTAYYLGCPIADAVPDDFVSFAHPSRGLARDIRRVYRFGKPIDGVTPETFTIEPWFDTPERMEHFPWNPSQLPAKRRPPVTAAD